MRPRSTLQKAALVSASTIVVGDTIRFLEPRIDGAERYVVGQVTSVFSRRYGMVTFTFHQGEQFTVTTSQEVEVL